MSTANFTVIVFEEHLGLPEKHRGSHVNDLGPHGNTLPASWPFVGRRTTPHSFEIDGDPDGPAYMIVRTHNQQDPYHFVLINDHELTFRPPDFQRLSPAEWPLQSQDNVLYFDAKFLRPHTNEVGIVMGPHSADDFVVECVVVHWHERPFTPPAPQG
jgi:hypothetical protein